MKDMYIKRCICLICLTASLAISTGLTADTIEGNPLHDPFTVKVINRGCNNGKFGKLEIANLLIPDYPIDMRTKGISGVVGIAFRLNQSGNPEGIKVLFASYPLLPKPVLDAVRGWKFDLGNLTEADKQQLKNAIFTYSFAFLLNESMNIEIDNT